MAGKTRKQPSKGIDEAQIVAWLKECPDFFNRHPDSLSAIKLPVDSGPAISLHQYQVRVLREEKSELNQKLGALLKNVKTNHKIHSDLLGLAGNMISIARNGAETDAFLALIKQHFALFEVQLFEKEKHPEVFKRLKSILGKVDSICLNAPDEELSTSIFKDNASRVLSLAAVQVKTGRTCRAYLVLASDDKERFRPGMGGEFLKLLAQLLSSLVKDEQN